MSGFGIYNCYIYRLFHCIYVTSITDHFQMYYKDVWYKIINPCEDILAIAELYLI